MKLVMTLMVRDEIDIVSSMLDHHLAQGIDTFIVTDNGSVDGTTDVLRDYEAKGLIELRHDPVHHKQQSEVVSRMASDAYTIHGADWVFNADADEFFLPVDRSATLRRVFERIPKDYQAFQVPVVNLTGPPACTGSGLQRLVYRDNRAVPQLRVVGLRAHASPDTIHVGKAGVVVAQGNHEVDLESKGAPDGELAIEVLHLPWRSWTQFAHKVEVSGRAYEENTAANPSPNHHGMRDYARLKAGTLLPFYLRRHPSARELESGITDGTYVVERTLAESLPSTVPDEQFDEETLRSVAPTVEALEDAQHLFLTQLAELSEEREALIATHEATLKEAVVPRKKRIRELEQSLESSLAHVDWLEAELSSLNNSAEIRYGKKLRRLLRRG